MFISKIAQASAFAGMIAISLWASVASAQSQSVQYTPSQRISYDFGFTSVSGSFVDQTAKCLVMLMVTATRDRDVVSSPAARVRLVLNPGQIAGLDSPGSDLSLNFTCGEGATTLVVDSGETRKLYQLQMLSLRKTASE